MMHLTAILLVYTEKISQTKMY
uniref:Uncharacterized protein n=1 Tax=Anguilla anguilla TaxID=7936 RepID=A0A0E9RGU0_ANGAN